MILYEYIPTPVGKMTAVCDGESLIGLWSDGVHPLPPGAREGTHPVLTRTARWLERYFAGERPDHRELPIRLEGTAFRQLIWGLLMQIPYGETVTYGDLAREAAAKMGKSRMSAQAVGGAVGANPVWIAVPCHRVVGSGGKLTGYAGGLEMKAALLALEAKHAG